MFSQSKSHNSKYAPLALHAEGEPLSTGEEKSFDNDNDSSSPTLSSSDDLPALQSSKPSALPKLILYASLLLALLSAINVALIPATLSNYLAYPFSPEELDGLPFPSTQLGLDRAALAMPPPQVYWRSDPDRIVRVSRRLKNAVYGDGVQVYITVEDSTIMRFPVPETGASACAISFKPPPQFSARLKDLETKGDITEVEVWSVIAPSASSPSSTPFDSVDELDFDRISYSTLPVRGELLGTLDMTQAPNTTTVDFACPRESDALVVELKCQRVACHIAFMQIDTLVPKFGFELVRRKA